MQTDTEAINSITFVVSVHVVSNLRCRYAQYGDISPKVDVYAFGVVLFELISAKDAILKTGSSLTESKGLIALVSFPVSGLAHFLIIQHLPFF